jgi:hypothetical protein
LAGERPQTYALDRAATGIGTTTTTTTTHNNNNNNNNNNSESNRRTTVNDSVMYCTVFCVVSLYSSIHSVVLNYNETPDSVGYSLFVLFDYSENCVKHHSEIETSYPLRNISNQIEQSSSRESKSHLSGKTGDAPVLDLEYLSYESQGLGIIL